MMLPNIALLVQIIPKLFIFNCQRYRDSRDINRGGKMRGTTCSNISLFTSLPTTGAVYFCRTP